MVSDGYPRVNICHATVAEDERRRRRPDGLDVWRTWAAERESESAMERERRQRVPPSVRLSASARLVKCFFPWLAASAAAQEEDEMMMQ